MEEAKMFHNYITLQVKIFPLLKKNQVQKKRDYFEFGESIDGIFNANYLMPTHLITQTIHTDYGKFYTFME